MKNTIFVLIFLLTLLNLKTLMAQDPNFIWGVSFGGTSDEEVNDIAVDSKLNIINVGNFEGTTDLDPGSGITSYKASGRSSVFIQKLDSNGNLLWSQSYGSSDFNNANKVIVDNSRNIYVSGYFSGDLDFDQGPEVHKLKSIGSTDAFVLKLDENGKYIWAISFNDLDYSEGINIALDPFGNLYAAGHFSEKIIIKTETDKDSVISIGSDDIHLSKFTIDGKLKWVKRYGSFSNDQVNSITTDNNGEIILTGSFFGGTTLDGITMISGKGGNDAFTAKYDSSGNYLWSSTIGEDWQDQGTSVDTDNEGNVYTTGYYTKNAVYNDKDTTVNLVAIYQYDTYIQKQSPNGKLIWIKGFGGVKNDFAGDITVDSYGNSYTTGQFIGKVDFDGGEKTYYLRAKNYWDNFLIKLDSEGELSWVNQISSSSGNTKGCVTHDSLGNIYTSNIFITTADINPGEGILEKVSTGGLDVYTLKFSQNCLEKMSNIDASVTYDDISITCNNINGTYRWLDCNKDVKVIEGEINQQFFPTKNGDYSVEVTENGCKNYSKCVEINGVTSTEFEHGNYSNTVKLFPNPTNGEFNIEFNEFQEHVNINVYALSGELIFENQYTGVDFINSNLPLSSGIYFVKISGNNENTVVFKLVKK